VASKTLNSGNRASSENVRAARRHLNCAGHLGHILRRVPRATAILRAFISL